MKKWGIALFVTTLLVTPRFQANAQSFELQQLILNLQKLNQLKSILNQLKQGYEILAKGYETVKDLSQGNFNLHKTFLDGLLQVSPTVRKYHKIADIIRLQQQLIADCKKSLRSRSASALFSNDELGYLEKVYADLIDRSKKNLEELLLVITANQLRMNDEQRLAAIDRIYADVDHKTTFLRHFNQNGTLLQNQRQRAMTENQHLQKLFNTK